jgi:hypothetical protein
MEEDALRWKSAEEANQIKSGHSNIFSN